MKNIFLAPNQITIIRIFLIPVFIAFLILDIPYKQFIAGFIFIVLSFSDMFDGYIARKRNQVTPIGKIMDPIADKLLISTALIFLIGKGVEIWMAAIIIARELIITIFRLIIMHKQVVPADNLGKIKTITQTIAILAVILNLSFSWDLMVLAVIITLVSGLSYFTRILSLLDEKILNIPNAITFMRISLLPLFIIALVKSKLNYAIILFAIIGASDKIDGISARITKQVTEFGKAFDSITDWSVFLATFFTFGVLGYIKFVFILLILIAAILIFALKLVFLQNEKTIPVTPLARISVAVGYITIISILINFPYKDYVLVLMLILVYLSMLRYLMLSLPVFLRRARN